jgi:hypothetical protein
MICWRKVSIDGSPESVVVAPWFVASGLTGRHEP